MWFKIQKIDLIASSGTDLLNHRNFLSSESYKGVFGYVNELSFEKHLGNPRKRAGCRGGNHVIGGLELSFPPHPTSWERSRARC